MRKILGIFIGLMISLTGLVFSACNETYENVTIKPSVDTLSLAVNEERTFWIEIENASNAMSKEVQLNNIDDLFSVLNTEFSDNKFSITIKGIKTGSTIVEVKTFEGNKSCQIKVEIYEQITSYQEKGKAYICKGEEGSYVLNEQDYFKFLPENTKRPDVKFEYLLDGELVEVTEVQVDGKEKVVLLRTNGSQIEIDQEKFNLKTSLVDNPDIKLDLQIDVINSIEVGEIGIIKKGHSGDYFTPPEVVPVLEPDQEPGQEPDPLILISNSIYDSYYELQVECFTANTLMKVTSSKCEAVEFVMTEPEFTTGTQRNYKFLSLQANKLGEETVTIEIYYKDYDYSVEKEFKVKTCRTPGSITINDMSEFSTPIILYNHNFQGEGTFPMNLKVYDKDSTFSSIDVSVVDDDSDDAKEVKNWDQYLNIYYKGAYKKENFKIPFSDFDQNVIKNPIILTGLKRYEKLFVKFVINSDYDLDEEVTFFVPIKIEEGAISFSMNKEYNGVLVLNVDDAKTFDGFEYESRNAYIGDMIITYSANAESYFEVKQIETNDVSIEITSKSIGEGKVKIMLGNGLSLQFTVRVVQEAKNIKLDVEGRENNKHIVKSSFENDSLNLVISYNSPKTITDYINLNLVLYDYSLPNEPKPICCDLFSLADWSVENEEEEVVELNPSKLLLTVKGVGEANVNLSFNLKKVEDFKIKNDSEKDFNIEITVFSPITEINFTTDNGSDNEFISQLSINRKQDVGCFYDKLYKKSFKVKAKTLDGNIIEDVFDKMKDDENFELKFKPDTPHFFLGNKLTNFGTYEYPQGGEGNTTPSGNTMLLICDAPDDYVGESFGITFAISRYGMPDVTNVLTINIEKYIPLDSIGFYNYQEKVYLSGTNNQVVFNTFIDEKYDCKEFDVKFIADKKYDGKIDFNIITERIYNGNFSYEYKVTITHTKGTGAGIGTIRFIPRSSYNERNEPTIYQDIAIRFSDGKTRDTALRINSPREFIFAMKNSSSSIKKYYEIYSPLDFKDVNVDEYKDLPDLTDVLIGDSQEAQIINFKIDFAHHKERSKNYYLGLFPTITGSGEISNISFSGNIDYEATSPDTSDTFYVGLIAGENNGILENVMVDINNSKINLSNTNKVSIGGIVGVNNGKIYTKVGNKEGSTNTQGEESDTKQTFNHTLINMKSFKVLYNGTSSDTSLGGIVGINNGVVKREIFGETFLYNKYVNTANVEIEAEGFTQVGGVAGVNNRANTSTNKTLIDENETLIKGQIVSGNIVSSRYSKDSEFIGGKNVGGIVGVNKSYINNCINRAYLKGYDYVGGIVGNDNSMQYLTNCKVQAPKTEIFRALILGTSYDDGNVGAISGNETSAWNKIYSANGNVATYYYEAVTEGNLKAYPVMYGFVNNVYTNIKYSEEDEFCCLFEYVEVKISVKDINVEKGTEVDPYNVDYKNRIVNMFYYEAKNNAEQKYIEYENLNRKLPFNFDNSDTISLTSFNPDILTITNDGKINLLNTGKAKILVKSLLDETLNDFFVYVNVINAFDGFVVQSSYNNILASSGNEITVYDHSSRKLEYRFTNSDITTHNECGKKISIELKDSPIPSLKIDYGEGIKYTEIIQNNNILIIQTLNNSEKNSEETRSNIVDFIPQFCYLFNDIVGNITIPDENADPQPTINTIQSLITGTTYTQIQAIITAERGTESLTANISSTTAQPLDEIIINISQKSNYPQDNLKITSIKVSDQESDITDYFKILRVTNYTENDGKYNYTSQDGQFVLQFNYEKYNIDYEGDYIITFTAVNGKSVSVTISLLTQTISTINLKNYYNVKEEYEYNLLETNYMASGGVSNLLVVELFPTFAEFDKIAIYNDEMNYENNNIINFKVCALNDENKFIEIDGITKINNKMVIFRKTFDNFVIDKDLSKIYVIYSTSSASTLNSQAKIMIDVINVVDGVDVVTQTASKIVTIIMRDNVYFDIVGKDCSPDNAVYVAKGVTYDLNLYVYGFTEDQIVINIQNKNKEPVDEKEVKIYKDNANWKLWISSDITYTGGSDCDGYGVDIFSWGENVVNGIKYTSEKSCLKLMIVDFVILTENIESFKHEDDITKFKKCTVIENAINGVANVFVGNSFNISTGFVSGLTIEYDTTNLEINNKVDDFIHELNKEGTWEIKALENNILGDYTKKVELTEDTVLEDNQNIKIKGSTDRNGNLVLTATPLKVREYTSPVYYFSYKGGFKYKGGKPCYADIDNLSTDFVLDVYPNSTEENAIPINNYKEFLQMRAGANYILMTDITLASDFVPLKKEIASLNGNGYSIYYPNFINFTDISKVGLFEKVSENTVLKNINIQINHSIDLTISNTDAITFGLIAGVNYGSITNCSITSKTYAQVNVTITNQANDVSKNYIAGLVGENNGYITNSRVAINLTAIGNIAGFVCINENKIASSYVKDSLIVNKSNSSDHKTSGFVIYNGRSINSDAQIITSYICGEVNKKAVYSTSVTKCISSNQLTSAFVFSNYCKIANCYSDIYLRVIKECSGFIYENFGNVSYCYSTSTFSDPGEGTFNFVVPTDNLSGTFEECYCLRGEVNDATKEIALIGQEITELTESGFADANNFKNFAISTNFNKNEAIWFWPSTTNESDFIKNGENMVFTSGKPELVSANIIVNSQKEITGKDINENNEEVYSYVETLSPVGSVFNPIIISSAVSFEEQISLNSFNNRNNLCYRIVNDLDYNSEGVDHSNLYNTIFVGTLDGNGMEIYDFTIENKATTTNSGLFAQIGQGFSSAGIVKNLILTPRYINFPNSTNAGTLAGLLEGGKIYDICCDGNIVTTTYVQIVGNNSVGGVIGVATNNFVMNCVESSISVKSTFDHDKDNVDLGLYQKNTTNKKVSYSGCIAGVVVGSGSITKIKVNGGVNSSAECAGLLFGYIGTGITLSSVNQVINDKMWICGTAYAGIISATSSGNLVNINVNGKLKDDFFTKSVIVSDLMVASGGLIGLMYGGEISNCNFNTDITWTSITATIIGGLVGEMTGGVISNSNFIGKINVASNETNYSQHYQIVVGGLVGKITVKPSIATSSNAYAGNVVLDGCKTNGELNIKIVNVLDVYIGGFVGEMINGYKIVGDSITSLYKYTINGNGVENSVTSKMKINYNAIIYGGVMNNYIGGIVGASFSDISMDYGGEVIIYDEGSKDAVLNKNSANSESQISIDIFDYKKSAIINLYIGGILGKGYSVKSITIINDNGKVWGLQLEKCEDKQITEPSYLGQCGEGQDSIFDSEVFKFNSNRNIEDEDLNIKENK